MQYLITHALAMLLVLGFLILLLVAPFLAVFLAVKICRDVHRIADAQVTIARHATLNMAAEDLRERVADAEDRRRVSNSMFAR